MTERVVGYTLRDCEDRIVYIGIINRPFTRIWEHERSDKWLYRFSIELLTDDRRDAARWEARTLWAYREQHGCSPRFND